MTARRTPLQAVAFLILAAATAGVALATRTPEPPSDPVSEPPQTGHARVEVVFVLDTTGSMSGLIEGAKHKIWTIADRLASGQPEPEIRMGLIGYRDRGDDYVTRLFELTDDVDAVYGHLQGFQAGGGGDTPESVNRALNEAVTRMSWTPGQNVYKVIFLVGDAPPHMDYPDDVPYAESVRLARERGIVVNTVQCGGLAATTPIWQAIAEGGLGRYASIAQDGAMVHVATPMDAKLARLNRELAGTALAYGDEEQKGSLLRKLDDALEAAASVAASRLSYLGKRGGRVSSGGGDLVDAVREGEVDLETLPAASLPAELQPLSAPEREAVVQQQIEKREELQAEIAGLTRAREDYLRGEWKRLDEEGRGDGFDRQVFETVRDQAASKGIRYE